MNRRYRPKLAPLHQRLCTVKNHTALNLAQSKCFLFLGLPPLCLTPEMHRISLARLPLGGAFDLHSFPLLLPASVVECAVSLDAGKETDVEVA